MFHPKRNHDFGNTSAAITTHETANNKAGSSRHKVKRKKPGAGQSAILGVSLHVPFFLRLWIPTTLAAVVAWGKGTVETGRRRQRLPLFSLQSFCASELPNPDLWITSSDYRDKAAIQKYLPKENFVIEKNASSGFFVWSNIKMFMYLVKTHF